MSLYTAVFVLCMVSPLMQDMSGREGNCISAAKAIDFASEHQCSFYLGQVQRRLSTRAGQDEVLALQLLPNLVDGRLKAKADCRVKKYEGYLQCNDCES